MLVEEGDAVQPVRFRSIPLPQVLLDSGYDDKIDHVFRERYIKFKQITVAYPKATIPERMMEEMSKNPDKDCKVIEVIYRNYENTKEEEYKYCVISNVSSRII